MDPHLILLGFSVAALVAITGVGGGSLLAPALIFGCGISPSVAVGTDLIYAAVTKAGALWTHARHGRVQWRVALLMLSGSVPAALAASAALWLVRDNFNAVNRIISVSLGAALLLSALAIIFQERIRKIANTCAAGQARVETIAEWIRSHRSLLAALIGAVVGALVTLSSVGAGALGVAALMLLFSSIDARAAVATDLAYGVLLAATAGAGHLALGNVDFRLLTNLLIGMAPGVYVGGLLTGMMPETTLRRLISAALVGAAMKLLAV